MQKRNSRDPKTGRFISSAVAELAPLFAVKELVEMRTVTAAQGHNADISIHGYTQRDGKGLSNDKRLAVVAQSRAKWMAIYILPGNAITGSEIAVI